MDILTVYLDKLQHAQAYLDPPGLVQVPDAHSSLLLEEIYVPLTLTLESEQRLPPKSEGEVQKSLPETPADLDPTNHLLLWEQTRTSGEHGLKQDELWEHGCYWVIRGGPGGGKTTLLKYLTLTEARRFQGGSGYLPLLFDAAEFIDVWRDTFAWTPTEALPNYLHGPYAQKFGIESEEARSAFTEHLKSALAGHNVLLLIDGFEQIQDSVWQQNLTQAIEALYGRYPGNRCIITSRPLSGTRNCLGQCFRYAVLEPFREAQMRQFFQRWLYAQEKNEDLVADDTTRRHAEQKAEEIHARLSAKPELYDHLNTPLLCTLIGMIYRNLGTLPDQPVALYKLCVDTLILQNEGQYRRLHPGAVAMSKDETRMVLENVALHLQEQRRKTLSYRNLQELIADTWHKEGMVSSGLEAKSKAFIEAEQNPSSILQNAGQDRCVFFHGVFQEYLAARAILRHPEQMGDYLERYLFQPCWRGVFRLAAAHQGMQDEAAGTAFIESLLNHAHPRENELHYSFRIAFQCMQETRVSAQLAERMFQTWMELYQTKPVLQPALNRLLQNGSSLRYKPRAITPLLDSLKSQDVTVRDKAVEALGHLKAPDTLPLLQELLKADPNPAIRAKAAEMLGEYREPAAVPALLSTVRGDTALMVRRRAAQALGKIDHPTVLPALRQTLEDRDATVRWRTVEALGYIRAPESVQTLLVLLRDDPVAGVRWRAAEALGNLRDPGALNALLSALTDLDTNVRSRATEALSTFSAELVLPALQNALKSDKFPAVRWRAAEALGKLRDPTAVPVLLETLRDDVDNAVRWSAAEALGDLQDRRAVPVLLKTLREDFDPAVRWSAADALGQLHDPSAIKVLLDAVNYDKYASVRGKACQSLGYLRDSSATPTLLKVLGEDENPTVRRRAAEALGDIHDNMAVTVLLHTLHQDEDSAVRWSVIEALGMLKDPAAIPALLQSLEQDPDLHVRWHAAKTLEILDLGEVL